MANIFSGLFSGGRSDGPNALDAMEYKKKMAEYEEARLLQQRRD